MSKKDQIKKLMKLGRIVNKQLVLPKGISCDISTKKVVDYYNNKALNLSHE